MPDTLRTRIAAALYARAIERLGWNRSWDNLWDNLGAPSQQLWLDVADAVIRELGWTTDDLAEGRSHRRCGLADDLRTRIAAVHQQHRLFSRMVGRKIDKQCLCGWRSPERDCTWTDHPDHLADVLIRELGLQAHLAKRIINGKPDQWVRRHVTDWEIVDE